MQRKHDGTPTAASFARLSGLAGIGFAILIVSNVTFLAPAGMPVTGADPEQVAAFFSTKGDLFGFASMVVPATWVLLTLFAAGAVAAL